MISVQGYAINDKKLLNSKSIVYRGTRLADEKPVIIKTLYNPQPASRDTAVFENEYSTLKNLKGTAGIVDCYELVNFPKGKAIVMEDIGGEFLDNIIQRGIMSVPGFLQIAIELVKILGEIHKKHVIHKDLTPANIIYNEKTNEIRIVDFSISTQLSRVIQQIANPDKLEGALPYISPEQTGRMNRSIDFRTDFYSLGVTFYELLTGRCPFESSNPLEIIHCHIARIPKPPHLLNNTIPPVLSDIILKLLSKNAEERYQSATGLKYDLELCLNKLTINETIEKFPLASHDVSSVFRIPEKIYGRDKEIAYLKDIYKSVSKGHREIVLIKGKSGIGKSKLINEIYKPISEQEGFIVSGKYDHLKKNIPFTAVIDAFTDIVREILCESEEELSQWKEKILGVVGSIGRVLTDLIPELEMIIGPQPPVQSLPANEAQNRFNIVLNSFIKLFATEKHPLVLFLDDLQWVDGASLQLIETLLLDPELQYFLLIGAYRDNEVDESHPFSAMMNSLEDHNVEWGEIQLHGLKENHISQILAETLFCNQKNVRELAGLVLTKTNGNPFFLLNFIQMLYKEQLINYSDSWEWDTSKVKDTEASDNVAELMTSRINRIQKNTVNILNIAACIGDVFYIDTLAAILQKKEQEIMANLTEAVDEGIILYYENHARFAHDRVRDTLYSAIDTKTKTSLHYQIGKTILENTEIHMHEERIFAIVNNLNIARKVLNDEETIQLIELNLKAGRKAKSSAAFEEALRFFKNGMEIFPDNAWETVHETALAITTERAEAEYLNANYDRAEELFKLVLDKAKTTLDKVRIYEIKIYIYVGKAQYVKALDSGFEALESLGIHFPKNPGTLHVVAAILKTKLMLGRKTPEDLIQLPELTDSKHEIIMSLLFTMSTPAIFSKPEYGPLFITKMIRLSLKHGNSKYASVAYSTYALIIAGALGEYDNAHTFGQFAFKLVEKYRASEFLGVVHVIFGYYILHWRTHYKDTLDYFLKGYKYSLDNGDFVFAPYTMNTYLMNSIFMGENLMLVEMKFDKFQSMLLRIKHRDAIDYFFMFKQFVLNLQDKGQDKCLLIGDHFNEETILDHWIPNNVNTDICGLYLLKAILLYSFRFYKDALKMIEESGKVIDAVLSRPEVPLQNFYHSLASAALYTEMDKKRKKHLKKIKSNQKRLKKFAAASPQNYKQLFIIIEAERMRISGKRERASKLYEEAIQLARENSFFQYEALANELAARHYLSEGNNLFFETYIREAYYCYEKWGAGAKTRDLNNEFSDVLNKSNRRESENILNKN